MKVNLLLSAFLVFTALYVSATSFTQIESLLPKGDIEPTEEWQENTSISDVQIDLTVK